MNKRYFYTSLFSIIFVLSLITNWYDVLVYLLTGSLVIMVLDKLGKGIVLRETIALHGCFVTLLMPLMSYLVYDENNYLARLWGRYMFMPKDQYFSYVLPATAGFVLAICFPMQKKTTQDEGQNLKDILHNAVATLSINRSGGLLIVLIGLITFFVSSKLPSIVQFAVMLFYFASFAGILYIYHTPNLRYKKPVLWLLVLFVLYNALSSGMFTIVAYMGITIFSFLFLKRKVAFWKKLAVFCFCLVFVFLLQSIKQMYRKQIWNTSYKGSNVELFADLMVKKITAEEPFFSAEAFFPIYYRTNQGYNVMLVLRRYPNIQQHDRGEALFLSIASSFVPRLLWPDKPEAGGQFNMEYYAGIRLRGWSTNVGPVAEAYGAFGSAGGILFMVVLGLFIRWAYGLVFHYSNKSPLLIFWIPFLFYQVTYAAETDVLQVTNSLIKAAFFLWILYRFIPQWFGRNIAPSIIKQVAKNNLAAANA